MKLLNRVVGLGFCLISGFLRAEGPARDTAAPIAVLMSFDGAPSARALTAMKEEVESVTSPAGLQLDWRLLKDRLPGEMYSDLAVVTFHGRCDMEGFQALLSESVQPRKPGAL